MHPRVQTQFGTIRTGGDVTSIFDSVDLKDSFSCHSTKQGGSKYHRLRSATTTYKKHSKEWLQQLNEQ